MFVNLTDVIAYIYDGEIICTDCYDGPEDGREDEESPIFEEDRDELGSLYCPYCQSDI